MKKILIMIYEQLKIIYQIGFLSYFKYRIGSKGKKIRIQFDGYNILVRKRTRDLDVAISCFNGEFDIIKHLFPQDYNGIIIDAGGYIGTSTLAIKKIFPNSKVIVVEPSDENMAILKENLAEVPNIRVVHGALVGESKKIIQLKNRGTGEWGFTVVSSPRDNPNSANIQNVRAFRLSDLVSNVEHIGLLKLDIEGGELNLLEHDMESLEKIEVVFAELHNRIAEGCENKYFEFSKKRILVKDRGEKYLSIKR